MGVKSRNVKVRKIALHPILFTVSWILLYFIGLDLTRNFLDLIIEIFVSIFSAVFIWYLFHKLIHSIYKSSILTSFLVIGLLYFDGIYELIYLPKFTPEKIRFFFTTLNGQFALLAIILIILGLLFVLFKRTKKELRLVSLFLDIFSIVLLLNFSNIIIKLENTKFSNEAVGALNIYTDWSDTVNTEASSIDAANNEERDIYYLVFDGYGGQDILSEYYDYSNQELIDFLTGQGFLVLKNGHTNYNQTRFSISSSLNMNYWQNFNGLKLPDNVDIPRPLCIDENVVFSFLREHGYKTITFATGLDLTDVTTSDLYFRPKISRPLINSTINNTFLSLFFWKNQYLRHSDMVEYAADTLINGTSNDTPVFVYAHFMLPHPPFIHDQNGEIELPRKKFDLLDNSAFINRDYLDNYINGYRNQIAYADKKIKEIITSIRKRSPDAVIIVQGDHGPGSHFFQEDMAASDLNEKFHILNAYFFPDAEYGDFPEDMTPVNTFRVLFNHYFGTNLALLGNYSYYSTNSNPYQFNDVTEIIH